MAGKSKIRRKTEERRNALKDEIRVCEGGFVFLPARIEEINSNSDRVISFNCFVFEFLLRRFQICDDRYMYKGALRPRWG